MGILQLLQAQRGDKREKKFVGKALSSGKFLTQSFHRVFQQWFSQICGILLTRENFERKNEFNTAEFSVVYNFSSEYYSC